MKSRVTIFIALFLLTVSWGQIFTPQEMEDYARTRPVFPEVPEAGLNDTYLGVYDQKTIINGKTPLGITFKKGCTSVGEGANNCLYWLLYESAESTQDIRKNIPLIIWLQGGPGASSLIGAMKEFGPMTIDLSAGKYFEKERTGKDHWQSKYHLLFVDQPVGTGYSQVSGKDKIPKNMDKVAEHFYQMVKALWATGDFTDFSQCPVYIMGEGFAGHYIAAIAKYFLDQQTKEPTFKFPLKGVGIGGGWVDPVNQMTECGVYSYSLGLVNEAERQKVEQYQLDAVLQIKHNLWDEALVSFGDVFATISVNAGHINTDNYKKKKVDYLDMDTYFNYKETKDAYGVPTTGHFFSKNTEVYAALRNDFMVSYADRLAAVMGQLKVLLWAGQNDVVANTPSMLNYISKLEWDHKDFWNQEEFSQWRVNPNVNGAFIEYIDAKEKVEFVIMYDAGAMVPMDQLLRSKEMIDTFISGGRTAGRTKKVQATVE